MSGAHVAALLATLSLAGIALSAPSALGSQSKYAVQPTICTQFSTESTLNVL